MRRLFKVIAIVLLLGGITAMLNAAPRPDQAAHDVKQQERQEWLALKQQQRDEKTSFNQQRHSRQERKRFKRQLTQEKALIRRGQRDETKNLKDNQEFAKQHPQP